ncbi:MAG: WbqC family protein [bacterium]
MKKVAVIQSNYVPWKGYFDIIHDVDLFIFYDDVQFTKNDWRNRNRIKTPSGLKWLSIPVGKSLDRLICEVEIKSDLWAEKHWKTITQNYGKAPFFNEIRKFFEEIYLEKSWKFLSELNQHLIRMISRKMLGIRTEFRDSREFEACGVKQERLLCLLKKAGAGLYVSGPSARNYIDEKRFEEEGIALVYKDYSGYPEYSQLYPPFEHAVSIMDLLFMTGRDAPGHIWGWRKEIK